MAKFDGYGALLEYDDANDGSWVIVGQIRDMDGPEETSDAIEATSQNDNLNNHRDYIVGLQDTGDLSFELIYDPAEATTNYLRETAIGKFVNFRTTYPDTAGTTWEFLAMCTSFSPKVPVDGLMTADVTLKCKGQITRS